MCRNNCCTHKIHHTTIISRHLECCATHIDSYTPTNVYFRSLLNWRRLFHRRAYCLQCCLTAISDCSDHWQLEYYHQQNAAVAAGCCMFLPLRREVRAMTLYIMLLCRLLTLQLTRVSTTTPSGCLCHTLTILCPKQPCVLR